MNVRNDSTQMLLKVDILLFPVLLILGIPLK